MTLFSALGPEGSFVSWLLLGLVLFALLLCLRASSRLRKERKFLALVDQALSTSPIADSMAAKTTLDEWVKEKPQAAHSVVIHALKEALNGNPESDEANVIRNWIHWPRYLAGIFVFIGLFGTVLSMSVAIGGLGTTIANTSGADAALTIKTWSNLLTGITTLLVGMKSAFACTLLGILATLLASSANWAYLRACDLFDDKLRRTISSLPLRQDAMTLNDAAQKLTTVSKTLFRLTTQLVDASTQMTGEATRLSESYERAGNVLDKVNGIPLEKYEDLSRSAESLADVARQMKEERNIQEEGHETVQGAAARMERAVSSLREDLAKSQKMTKENLEGMVSQVQNTHRSLDDVVRRFERVLNDVAAVAEESPVRQELQALRLSLEADHRRGVPVVGGLVPASANRKIPNFASPDPGPGRNGGSQSNSSDGQASSGASPTRAPGSPLPSRAYVPAAVPPSRWQRLRGWMSDRMDGQKMGGRKR